MISYDSNLFVLLQVFLFALSDNGIASKNELAGKNTNKTHFMKIGTIGAMPGSLSWTKDCSKLVVAIEGGASGRWDAESGRAWLENPEGGTTIISMDDPPTVKFLSFKDFGVNKASETEKYLADGVRWSYGPGSMRRIYRTDRLRVLSAWYQDADRLILPESDLTLMLDASQASFSKDLEPQHVAISSQKPELCYVSLQNNNAIGVLNLTSMQWSDVRGLGSKKWQDTSSGFDATRLTLHAF